MSETLIKVDNVSKKFCRSLKRSLWYGINDLKVEMFGRKQNKSILKKDEFWAVKDISFEVKRGECLGLIGRNGAGKSTLLKMLNGLINPDTGRIEMHGRTGALIELGTGFNPILTGKENVFTNGTILGFSQKEIREKYDAIVAFSELKEFMDTPLQYYSSGMKVRLGFAVAAQMEPDVLIIDEVLAVGDAGFRIKCYNEIYRILKKAAVILVTHSMPQVAKICNRVILLDNGVIQTDSIKVSEVTASYYNSFASEEMTVEGKGLAKIHEIKFGIDPEVLPISLSNSQPPLSIDVEKDEKATILMKFSIDRNIKKFIVLLSFSDVDQKLICQDYYLDQNESDPEKTKELCIEFNTTNFNTGKFSLSIHFMDFENDERRDILAGYRSIIKFSIVKKNFFGTSPILLRSTWKVL
ncbi:MAG TPA: ABC transporter ATP-binding protein [Bacteroidia bacterium]|nr:ABC transporter ATP-binding protein [Bacteroidia bacterium]